jgi:hypothetical protein
MFNWRTQKETDRGKNMSFPIPSLPNIRCPPQKKSAILKKTGFLSRSREHAGCLKNTVFLLQILPAIFSDLTVGISNR